MFIVSEAVCQKVMDRPAAYKAVEAVFSAMAKGDAYNFPVIREAIGHADALYGFKSGFDRAGLVLGLKSGGFWPGNMAKGLTNHQSTVFLFNADTGQPKAMIGGNFLTALRTAAAAAISVNYLARKDAKVLGIVGAGHQSAFQLKAVAEQRDFEHVVGWNIDPAMLSRVEDAAKEMGLTFEAVDLPTLGEKADVIVTITSSFDPIVLKEHVTPGTHLSCMGTDTKGKQEVEAALVAAATCFTDEVAQSVSIGETQHAIADGLIAVDAITTIGQVINGDHPGRSSDDEITLFDGTGVGLQDLAVAQAVLDIATASGDAVEVAV